MRPFIFKIIFLFPLFVLVPVTHAEMITRTTGDGKQIVFEVKNGIPVQAENDWAKVIVAGFVIDFEDEIKDRSYIEWAFGLEIKYFHIAKIDVYDVSEIPERLIVATDDIIFENNQWIYTLPPIPITREGYPWLYDEKDTALIFKFVMEDNIGRSKTMYQLAIFSVELKKQLISR